MPDQDQQLEDLRRHAFGVAYRMLGSVADAEDVVQEALIRFTAEDAAIDTPAAWMTTVTTRLAIDVLRSARVRREHYAGPWIPEPLLEDPGIGPATAVEMSDSLSQALLVALERLTPVERAVFLLREVFAYDYPQIAVIVRRSEANCRQLAVRAKKHVEAARPRFDPDPVARDELLERFLAAAEEGDLTALEQLLAEDAVLYSDGGGRVAAASRPVLGAAAIARFFVWITRRRREIGAFASERVRVNGQPGQVLRGPIGRTGEAPAVSDVLSADVVDGRIRAIRIVRNPDKLAHL